MLKEIQRAIMALFMNRILSDEQVRLIMLRTKTENEMALEFGVSPSTIGRICRGLSYRHITKGKSSPRAKEIIRNVKRKLTDEQVIEIRTSDKSTRSLAIKYGIGYDAIRKARMGITYKHVNDSDNEYVMHVSTPRNFNRIFTPEQVHKIREMGKSMTKTKIANKFFVHVSVISRILSGERYRNV